MNNNFALIEKITNYFENKYSGDDNTSPKMELSANELRIIITMNTEIWQLKKQLNNFCNVRGE